MLLVILVVYVFLNSRARRADPGRRGAGVAASAPSARCICSVYSLDNFSLMALTIATGFVVDDAIVVMENTTRHIEGGHGAPAGCAAGRAGSRLHRRLHEPVAGRRVHSLPVRGGIVGRLFKEFTVTLSVAILISLLVSLTTTPMMCARLLVRSTRKRPTRFGAIFDRGFDRLRSRYVRTLDWALEHPRSSCGRCC